MQNLLLLEFKPGKMCTNCNKLFIKNNDLKHLKESEFCCKFCSHSYSGKQVKGTKIAICNKCHKKFIVDIRTDLKKIKCKKCKRVKCKYCGQYVCLKKDICRKYQMFKTLIKCFNFDKNSIGTIKIYTEYDRIKKLLINEYMNKNLSLLEIKTKYKLRNAGILYPIFRSLNINRKSISKSVSLFCFKNHSYKQINLKSKYKHGWHISWNNKKVYYRSSYELDYAKELDAMKIDYEMESLRFLYCDSKSNIQKTAVPDFYLLESNTIVEIKSSYTYDKQNMNDKVKAYQEKGYNFKLILDHKEINWDEKN